MNKSILLYFECDSVEASIILLYQIHVAQTVSAELYKEGSEDPTREKLQYKSKR